MVKVVGDKKGELTTAQLVTIIILIVSFIIILFLIFRLNPGEQTNKEICHNSVVLRAKSAGISGPLDCRTNYLCISGGDECTEIPTTSKADVNLNGEESKDEVMESIAKEMSDCWYMFGEGKVNYGTAEGTSVKYALCSVIEFDEKVQEKISEISYVEFYDYLRKTQKENSQSYLSYIYGVSDMSSLEIESEFSVNINQDKIKTSERYSIITGIDDNISPFPDEVLKVYIIPTSETSSRLDQGEFITKA